jgi:transcriptional pleiotropic regulator of transition state genes
MIKKIEEAGKFFIPLDYMQQLRWHEGDNIEVFLRGGELGLRKLTPSCVFCNSEDTLVKLGRLCACRSCIERLYEANDGDYLYPF